MVRVVGPVELDDVVLLVGQLRRQGLAAPKVGERRLGPPAVGAPADGGAVLALRRLDPAEHGGVPLELARRRDAADVHASSISVSPVPGRSPARRRRYRRGRHGSLDLVAGPVRGRAPRALRPVPARVLFRPHQLAVDFLHLLFFVNATPHVAAVVVVVVEIPSYVIKGTLE